VRRIQDLARPSLNWWENFAEYARLPSAQFVFHFLTRSGRVGRDRLRRSDPDFLARAAGHLLADPDDPVLGSPLAATGSCTSPIRLVALGEPNQTAPPGTWTAPDLGGQMAPGSASDVTVTGCGDRAVWLCSPETLDELDGVLSRARPLLDPARVVLVDAVTGLGPDSQALLTQQRAAEILRLRLNKTTVLVRRKATADEAATLVLSGRADAVAVPADSLPDLLSHDLAGG
jgi:salicyloyl-CoA 5-hydroxylase